MTALFSGLYKFLGLSGSILLAVSVALSVVLTFEKLGHAETRQDLTTMTSLRDAEVAAHKQTVSDYRIAAEKARREDAENKARAEREQRVITERIERDYQARLADARAAAERLRQQLKARAHPRPAGDPAMPGDGDPSGVPDGTPAEDGFSIADRLTATEQAIQLDELQRWVRDQLTVDLTAGSSSRRSPTGSR